MLSQNQLILKHLKRYRSITALEAQGLFRCFRLASRINELRARGVQIETRLHSDSLGKRYARYILPRTRKAVARES